MKITSNSTNNRQERQKEQNDESFPKEFLEITTLQKPVLKKIENVILQKYFF